MSGRGATWRGRHEQRFDQRIRSRKGQRNRRVSDKRRRGQLADFPAERFEHLVRKCRGKAAHATRGAAYAAKRRSEREYGKEFHIYECPICGKWHLTTHPWGRE